MRMWSGIGRRDLLNIKGKRKRKGEK
jgi:hypothetical protein